MKPLLLLTLGAAVAASACTPTPSDTATTTLDPVNASAARTPSAAVVRPAYRDVTIAAGTTLPLTLTSSVASDSSAVSDAVTAELTSPLRIDDRDVLPAGTLLSGIVTDVDDSGRVKGRAMIAFRFTSLRTGNSRYDIESASVSRLAPATKGEDATKIGVGAGAGAVIGGILGGKDGAAKGAAIGGGAGTGVVLATKGQEVRLGPGTDVTTRLTAPVTVRISRN
jgi:hypothetical protein